MKINQRELAFSEPGEKLFTFAPKLHDIPSCPTKSTLPVDGGLTPRLSAEPDIRRRGERGKVKRQGKAKVVPDAERIQLDQSYPIKDLYDFIDNLAAKQRKPFFEEKCKGKDRRLGLWRHRLNPYSMELLKNKLWETGMKALERHDAKISPQIPFIKEMMRLTANGLAQGILRKQVERGESDYALDSLDEPMSDEADSETEESSAQEDPERIRIAQLRKDCEETLARLEWWEQLMLEPFWDETRTKVYVAEFLGVSRPTLDAFIEAAGAKLRRLAGKALYIRG